MLGKHFIINNYNQTCPVHPGHHVSLHIPQYPVILECKGRRQVRPWAQNITKRGELQHSDIYQSSCHLLIKRVGKLKLPYPLLFIAVH